MTVTDGQQVFTTREAGEVLRCSESTVQREVKAGRLRCFRTGSRIRITRKQLDEFMEGGQS